jgi:hypothetical protein
VPGLEAEVLHACCAIRSKIVHSWRWQTNQLRNGLNLLVFA